MGRPAAPRPLLTHPTPAGPPPLPRGGRVRAWGQGERGRRHASAPAGRHPPSMPKARDTEARPAVAGPDTHSTGEARRGEARAHPAQPKDHSRGTFDAGVHPLPKKEQPGLGRGEERERGAHARPRRPCPVAPCRTRSPPAGAPNHTDDDPPEVGRVRAACIAPRPRSPALPACRAALRTHTRARTAGRQTTTTTPPSRPPYHARNTTRAPQTHTQRYTHTDEGTGGAKPPPLPGSRLPQSLSDPPPPLAGEGGGVEELHRPRDARPRAPRPPPPPGPPPERGWGGLQMLTPARRAFLGVGCAPPPPSACVCVCVVGCVGVGGGAGGRRREVRARVCVRVGVRDARGEGTAPCAVRGVQHAPSKGRGGASGGEREWKGRAGGAWPGGGVGGVECERGTREGTHFFFFQKPSPSIEVRPRGRE